MSPVMQRQAVTETRNDESPNRQERRHPDLSVLLNEFPPWILRTFPRLKELSGYTGRSLANLDCLGETKDVQKIMLGNTVAYERASFVKWLESRSRIIT
jgi:hypothetical protein